MLYSRLGSITGKSPRGGLDGSRTLLPDQTHVGPLTDAAVRRTQSNVLARLGEGNCACDETHLPTAIWLEKCVFWSS